MNDDRKQLALSTFKLKQHRGNKRVTIVEFLRRENEKSANQPLVKALSLPLTKFLATYILNSVDCTEREENAIRLWLEYSNNSRCLIKSTEALQSQFEEKIDSRSLTKNKAAARRYYRGAAAQPT